MRLIDVDKLDYTCNADECGMLTGCCQYNIITEDEIDSTPTVEAIPKADYEARLKADLKAILVDLKLEIEECVDGAEGSAQFEQGVTIARVQVVKMIQQKINSLKAESEDKE